MSDTGDERAPKPQKGAKDIVTGLEKYLPGYAQYIRGQILPTEQSLMKAKTSIAPEQQRLNYGMYKQFAPKYAKTQAQLGKISSRGELDTFKDSGASLIGAADAASRAVDPEYYTNRATASKRLEELMGTALTPGEIEAITRGIQASNVNMGMDNVQSNTQTAANALQFGQAARNNMMSAVGATTNALPSFRSSDMNSIFEMGTGRNRNINQNMQAADTSLSGEGIPLATGFADLLGGVKLKGMDINANRRTMHDFMAMGVNSAGSII